MREETLQACNVLIFVDRHFQLDTSLFPLYHTSYPGKYRRYICVGRIIFLSLIFYRLGSDMMCDTMHIIGG